MISDDIIRPVSDIISMIVHVTRYDDVIEITCGGIGKHIVHEIVNEIAMDKRICSCGFHMTS